MSQNLVSQNLVAHRINLSGKHLIEASAGTGKTFNITRIYLRMLLERKLPVEKILVMTFTKDATQELKGRIDSTIRQALADWPQLIQSDVFYQAIAETVSNEEAQFLLKKALLFLDEAAIFTIHGFCQRVLTEHAFATKMAFDASLETDLSDIVQQATQDCYRILASDQPQAFLLLSEFWQTPDSFISAFAKAIYQRSVLDVLSEAVICENFGQEVQLAIKSVNDNKSLIYQVLIDSQKNAKQTERIAEFNELHAWLSSLYSSLSSGLTSDELIGIEETHGKMPTAFFNGTRYARSPQKAELLAVFEPVKAVKTSYEKFAKSIKKAKAFALVRTLVYQIRDKIRLQKQQVNVLGFDDLISNLASALTSNQQLADRIRQDYPVALVDEFQDTDPDQFTILNALYSKEDDELEITSAQNHKNDCAVFMIGDPKQAIYGFRGGDVFAYLAAREKCQYQWVMDTNWRSSANMIAGYNRLFYGASLETEGAQQVFGYNIPYLPVQASPNAKPELAANDNFQALQFIYFEHEKGGDNQKVPQSFRADMASWCAHEINRLLTTSLNKPLQAQNIAILVRDGTEAAQIKIALEQAGLASVYLSDRSNLFESDEAQQLAQVLKGILYCDNDNLFSAAIASPLFNYHAKAYYQLQQDEQAWQNLKFAFDDLRKHWLNKSFMSMALKLMHGYFVIQSAAQDRALTNLLHLFELLQIASQRHHQPHELLFWLEQHIQGAANITETELRLDSDDDLIKIVTQHGSKGLEYPVVFIPFASRYKHPLKLGNSNIQLIEYHDHNKQLHLSLDGSDEAKAAMVAENHAETIRLLYVAITRAEQRCYVLTTDFEHADKSPIGSTLKVQQAGQLLPALQNLAQSNGIGLQTITEDELTTIKNAVTEQAEQDHAIANETINKTQQTIIETPAFTSIIERDWWLSSFSALTRHTSHSGISTPDRDNDSLSADMAEAQSHLMRFQMIKGAQAGNFLHDVFELLDFSQPNWPEALKRPITKYQYLLDGFSESELMTWLTEVINTPLLAGKNGLTLASLTKENTLRETEFYFPMLDANMAGLANILSDHRNHKRNLLADPKTVGSDERAQNEVTTPQVNLPLYRKLKGMMHGFIDLIFQSDGKFYVCDYKSSHLGDSFNDYQEEHLLINIEGNYYDLQYLIYSLALHRYLKVQLPDYQAEQHFGGVFYLYLRGMSDQPCGVNQSNKNSQQTGVYFTQVLPELLEQLDSLFSGAEFSANTTASISESSTKTSEHN
ncbi:exodeoxyribonuclease V subunit beta [Thalassotalea agariperforans]